MDLHATRIETERLLLVPINRSYAEDIFAEFKPELTTYMFPRAATGIDETLAFIETALSGLADGSDLQLVVLDSATRKLIGAAGLHRIGTPDPELGIWIKKSAHGNGYGTEAVGGIIAWARRNVVYSHLRYPVDRRNLPSRKIAERFGGSVGREYRKVNQSGVTLDLLEYWIL